MANDARNIFISYRRADAAGHAGRIYDSLARVFGAGQLFMDVAAIQPGETFAERIDRTLNESGAVLVIIGREWMNRLQAPREGREDFVRHELTTALKHEVLIVPVLVQGAAMPAAQDLPEDLRPLAKRNAIELSDSRWDYDMARLSQALSQAPGVNMLQPAKPASSGSKTPLWTVAGLIVLALVAFGIWKATPRPVKKEVAIPTASPAPSVSRERVLFHVDDRILQDFLERLTAAIEQHDWRMVLTLFQGANFKGQTEIGIDQPQYIAEGLGLHTVSNSLTKTHERIEFSHLDKIEQIELSGMTGPDNEGLLSITGHVLLQDGTRLKVEIPLHRTETGGYELAPAVG